MQYYYLVFVSILKSNYALIAFDINRQLGPISINAGPRSSNVPVGDLAHMQVTLGVQVGDETRRGS